MLENQNLVLFIFQREVCQHLENKESNKEEIEDNLKFDDQKIELTKKGN